MTAWDNLCMHTKTYMWMGPTLVAMATTFGLGAEYSRLPACSVVKPTTISIGNGIPTN